MLKNKPYFVLRIESQSAGFEAKLNGVVILSEYNGSSVITELPVNQFILNGKNRLSLVLFPDDDGGFGKSKVSTSLYVKPKGDSDQNRKLVGQVAFSADERNSGGTGISQSMPALILNSEKDFTKLDDGDVKISAAKIGSALIDPEAKEVSQEILLNTEFPSWKYLKAETLDFPLSQKEYTDNMETYDEKILKPLYNFNLQIFQLFKNKDIEGIVALMSERNSEMDAAFHLENGTHDNKLREELISDFETKNAVIDEFDYADPTISDDKKLIRIGQDGMIYLTDKNKTVFSYYDMWFYRKDGKWHISR